jgi:CRISPR-associated protein Csb2
MLHRHPKRRGQSMEDLVAECCAHAGLPTPSEIVATTGAQFEGGADAREFTGIASRPHLHVMLAFDRPVRGPMLIGAGRYRGYGLCRPLDAA